VLVASLKRSTLTWLAVGAHNFSVVACGV